MSTNSKSLAYSRAKGTMEELKTVDTGILGYMEDVPFSTGAISWYCVYESLGGIITAS
tara:strand:- start:95 stop:268 length:174 start_codon:yes stop_codon:yes gene_type:complete